MLPRDVGNTLVISSEVSGSGAMLALDVSQHPVAVFVTIDFMIVAWDTAPSNGKIGVNPVAIGRHLQQGVSILR